MLSYHAAHATIAIIIQVCAWDAERGQDTQTCMGTDTKISTNDWTKETAWDIQAFKKAYVVTCCRLTLFTPVPALVEVSISHG